MVRVLLSAALTATLAFAVPVPEAADVSALLQTSVTRDCQCLRFKDVYANHDVRCKQGEELSFTRHAGSHRITQDIFDEICTQFFFKFNDKHCVQRSMGSASKEQWCYVSSACQDLNGGAHVNNTDVSWKICEKGKDQLLQAVKPMALPNLAAKSGVDVAMLMKFAYPAYRQGLWWPGIQMSLGLMAPEGNITHKRAIFHGVQALDEPVLFDSVTGRLPYGVVWGKEVIEATYSDYFVEHLKDRDTLLAHLPKLTTLKCHQGNCTTE